MAANQPLSPVVGNVVRVTGPFLQNGVGVAPSGTIRFFARDPTNLETIYVYGTDIQVIADNAYTFHVDWPLSLAGEWRFRVEAGTGSGQAAGEITVTVAASIVL